MSLRRLQMDKFRRQDKEIAYPGMLVLRKRKGMSWQRNN